MRHGIIVMQMKGGAIMKKVSGYIDVGALGCHHFEFYVENNTTEEKIKELVDEECDYFIYYTVESGYEEVTKKQ